MDEVKPVEDKNSVLRDDRKLVCSMLVVYGLCILGLVAGAAWGLDRRGKKISADATSTAFAHATQQAKAAATAVAHITEQAQYELIDHFNDSRYWEEGENDDEYSVDEKKVANGVYVWEIYQVKKPFVTWDDLDHIETSFPNYDVYVDTRIVKGEPGEICSGLIFGESAYGFDGGVFVFVICNDSSYYLSHHSKKDGWQDVVRGRFDTLIKAGEWNRLEVSSRGTHFAVFVNGNMIWEKTDGRLTKGGVGLIIDARKGPATIQFDNFGFQSR